MDLLEDQTWQRKESVILKTGRQKYVNWTLRVLHIPQIMICDVFVFTTCKIFTNFSQKLLFVPELI